MFLIQDTLSSNVYIGYYYDSILCIGDVPMK